MTAEMTQVVASVDEYIGRHKRAIGLLLLLGAFIATAFASTGLTLSDALRAAPL
jgi:hypothetical protein